MTVALDELERLLKRYVSTGAAVVVVLLGSGQAGAPDAPTGSGQATTVTVQPTPAAPQRSAEPTPVPSAAHPATEGTTAAATHGWGTPTRAEEFDGGAARWQRYDGPGPDGKGRRSPSATASSRSPATRPAPPAACRGARAAGTAGGRAGCGLRRPTRPTTR